MFRLKVKEVAENKGTSQRQLFLRSGVDITTIRKIFRDPQTVVTVETLTRLANVLEVDVSALIESAPDQPADSAKSDQPAKPVKSYRPAKPAKSNRPAKPAKSNQPAKPAESDRQKQPDQPDPDNTSTP